jgi:hypothetical protein
VNSRFAPNGASNCVHVTQHPSPRPVEAHLKCSNPMCRSTRLPQISGPYDLPYHPYIRRVAYAVCPDCDTNLGPVPPFPEDPPGTLGLAA